MEQLKLYRAYQDGLRVKFADEWIETGFVFTRDNGEIMNPTSITQWIREFSDKVGLHGYPHKFRHTMGS